MSRIQLILGLVLGALALGAGFGAWRIWQNQQRSAAIISSIPPPPDVSRWAPAFQDRLKSADIAARESAPPVEALAALASLYFVNGFASEAAQLLTALRRLDPTNARWAYLAADLRLRVGDQAGAITLLREVNRLDPGYVPAWIRLGDVFTEQSAFDDAERCYLQAAAAAPGTLRAGFALTSFEAFHGKRGDPRRELQQLATTYPGVKPVHELLARMNEVAGDTAGAAAQRRLANAAKRYVPLDDPWIDDLYVACFDPNRLSLLAGKMEREGRYEAAVARLARAIKLAPSEPALRNSLAQVHIVANQPEAAVGVLRQAVTDCPDDPALRERLAMLLRTGKRHDEAVAVARAAVARWPQDPGMQTALGQALREAGQTQAALNVLLAALQLDPGQAEACYAAGYCLLATNRREEAKAYVTRALDIRPDYLEALLLRASMAIERGDVAVAEPAINRLMVLRGDESDTHLLFAALHLIKGNMARDTGNSADAMRLYRTGLAVFPDFPPLLREAGLLARKFGQQNEARQFFEQGLRATESLSNEPQAIEFRQLLAQP